MHHLFFSNKFPLDFYKYFAYLSLKVSPLLQWIHILNKTLFKSSTYSFSFQNLSAPFISPGYWCTNQNWNDSIVQLDTRSRHSEYMQLYHQIISHIQKLKTTWDVLLRLLLHKLHFRKVQDNNRSVYECTPPIITFVVFLFHMRKMVLAYPKCIKCI